MKGRYYNMWRKQIRAERAADKAFQAVAKAKALQEAALARPGSSGNEGSPSEDVSENEADNRSSSTTLVTPSLATKALVQAAENLRDRDAASSDGSNFGDDQHDDSKPPHDTQDDTKPPDAELGQEQPGQAPSKSTDQPKQP